MGTCSFQKRAWDDFRRMPKYIQSLSLLNCLLLSGALVAQDRPDWEIPVISKLVGTTIDIPEQEYYQVFDNIDGFLTAQFVQTGSTFRARIRTLSGWRERAYTARQFYDVGLAIDLMGNIDPVVLSRLKGEPNFERVMVTLQQLPEEVSMTLYLQDGGSISGRYLGLDGHHFVFKKRRSLRTQRISMGKVSHLKYRDPPVAEVVGDSKIFAATALLGMTGALGISMLTGIEGFNARAGNFFRGGLVGLAIAPLPVRQIRILRGEVHGIEFEAGDVEKVRTYLFMEYGES